MARALNERFLARTTSDGRSRRVRWTAVAGAGTCPGFRDTLTANPGRVLHAVAHSGHADRVDEALPPQADLPPQDHLVVLAWRLPVRAGARWRVQAGEPGTGVPAVGADAVTPAARQYLASLTSLKLAICREQDRVQVGEPPTGQFAQEVVLAIDDRQAYAESLGMNAPSARPT